MTALECAVALARGGRSALEANRQRINDLNVYPVPDGDTGSNLTDTAANLVEGLLATGLNADDRPAIALAATRAALMGARGNSGVILSQIVRGFAQQLSSEAGTIDGAGLARALRAASDAAYGAVRQPVEGTMLTAIRRMAETAEAGHDRPLDELLDEVLAAADETVRQTREMLPVLSEAGVVDAGAAGLVEFVRGAIAGLRGDRDPAIVSSALAAPITIDLAHAGHSRFRYCTTFVIEGELVERERLEALLDPLGDSLLVVGESPTYKVHVHTDDPGAALSLGVAMGTIDRVEIANMHDQSERRTLRLLAAAEPAPSGRTPAVPASGLVAVVAGAGNQAAFAALGAITVPGGQAMNPSTQELAAAIAAAPGKSVVLLPNNGNVILAAEHAAALAERPVRVVPTRSIAAGLYAAARFDGAAAPERNAAVMLDALDGHASGELTQAVRDATVDGVSVLSGWYLGLIDGRLVEAGPDAAEVASALAARMAADGRLTVIRGETDVFPFEPWIASLRDRHPDADVSVVAGGQPLYPLLLSAATATPSMLTAQTTAIVLDSTADLDLFGRPQNWTVVPLIVSFGDDSFADQVEIGPDEFYRRLEQGDHTPRTAAPSPGAWQQAMESLDGYRRLLVLPVSGKLSASSDSAAVAARTLDPDGRRITVLEGGSVSVGTLLLADGLQRRLVRGVAENELMEWFESAKARLQVVFSVETLEYLQRGGRIGRGQALVGGVLGVLPIMALQDGEVAPVRRVRGRRRARAEFERFLRKHSSADEPLRVGIVHAGNHAAANELAAMVARVRPQATVDHVVQLGAVVGTHGGPGTLGHALLSQA
jgi:DAK2 domain fusion protein YloV